MTSECAFEILAAVIDEFVIDVIDETILQDCAD